MIKTVVQRKYSLGEVALGTMKWDKMEALILSTFGNASSVAQHHPTNLMSPNNPVNTSETTRMVKVIMIYGY